MAHAVCDGVLSAGYRRGCRSSRNSRPIRHRRSGSNAAIRCRAGYAVRGRLRQSPQTAQSKTSPVNIRDAPPSVPASVEFLGANQIVDGVLHRGIGPRHAVRRQSFERAAGNIGARRIEHGVVVRKGDVAQELPVVVDIKRRPAAVLRLHREQPVESPILASLLCLGVGAPRMRETSITIAVSSISG